MPCASFFMNIAALSEAAASFPGSPGAATADVAVNDRAAAVAVAVVATVPDIDPYY